MILKIGEHDDDDATAASTEICADALEVRLDVRDHGVRRSTTVKEAEEILIPRETENLFFQRPDVMHTLARDFLYVGIGKCSLCFNLCFLYCTRRRERRGGLGRVGGSMRLVTSSCHALSPYPPLSTLCFDSIEDLAQSLSGSPFNIMCVLSIPLIINGFFSGLLIVVYCEFSRPKRLPPTPSS